MALTLYVDGERWRSHLRSVADGEPDLVPVLKGNGYGFGVGRLARRSAWLGLDTVAVGQYEEVAEVERRFDGSVLVMTPWRPFHDAPLEGPAARRIVHTVGRGADLAELVRRSRLPGTGPRVVLELLTSMRRHGFTPAELRDAVASVPGSVSVEGIALHLPLPDGHGRGGGEGPGAGGAGGGHLAEVERLMTDVVAADLETRTVWVSHLRADELARLRAGWPDHQFRPRVGTDLWLGDRTALHPRATVLDVHAVGRGEPFGYRGRTSPRAATLVVVSGGTSHGIGLEAPAGADSVRSRASSLARGGLEAAGFARSPFSIAGKRRLFAEPPHMQVSMLLLPAGVDPPAVGAELDVRVRYTTTGFDRVVVD